MQEWRSHGLIDKLYNIVVFIRRSPQRRDTFRDLADDDDDARNLVFVADNVIRWNSVYLMIDRTLKKQQQIDTFVEAAVYETRNRKLPLNDKLTTKD